MAVPTTSLSHDPRWPPVTHSVTPQSVSQRPVDRCRSSSICTRGIYVSGPVDRCPSSSLCTRGIYVSGPLTHLSYKQGSGGVNIEDFWESWRHALECGVVLWGESSLIAFRSPFFARVVFKGLRTAPHFRH